MPTEQEIRDIERLEKKEMSDEELKSRYGYKIPDFYAKWRETEISNTPEKENKLISKRKFEKQVLDEFKGMIFDKNLGKTLIRENLSIIPLLELICQKLTFFLRFEYLERLFEEDATDFRRNHEFWIDLNNHYHARIDRKAVAALKVEELSPDRFSREITEGVLLSVARLYKVIRGGETLGLMIRDQKVVLKEQLLNGYVDTQVDLLRYCQNDPKMTAKVAKEIIRLVDAVIGSRIKSSPGEYQFWEDHKPELLSDVYDRLYRKVHPEEFLLYSDLNTYINGIARNTASEIFRNANNNSIRNQSFSEQYYDDEDEEDDSPTNNSDRKMAVGEESYDESFYEINPYADFDLPWAPFHELYTEARRALIEDKVTRKQLDLFILKHKEGLSTEDLIRITGVPDANALGSRLNRAKNAFWREICKSAIKRNLYLKKCHERS